MEIRQANPTDAQEICDIWNPVIRDTLATFNTTEKTAAGIRTLLKEKADLNHPFLLAVQNKQILGFVTYGQFRAGPGYQHTMEHTIVLAPSARNKGAGKTLMHKAEEHAKANYVHSLFGGVSSANNPAIKFHKSCGFTEIATLPAVGYKFERWLDLVLLQKLL